MSVDSKNHYENKWFNSYRNECILTNYYYSEESFPYQLIQKELSSEGFIINPITNPLEKSPEIYRKGFPHQFMQKEWSSAYIGIISEFAQNPQFRVLN